MGELYIGGDGVGRGYLNRDALTTERFLTDPFSDDPTARMYRTGDLGRWRADGTIEFVGRNDHQVKIRGFRIELGEIEARLSAHADVRECVVVALADTTGSAKRLVAYWVGAEDVKSEHLGAEALRSWLSAVLPDYMVPAAYVRLDRLPLTPNGKLDRKALPAPDGAAYAARAYEAPQGATEQTIAAIWRDLLGLETIGRHDNFFALGGHSLLAVRVASRLRQELGVEIGVADLFVHATLHQLAACVTSSSGAVLPPIVSIELDAPRVLSFAQQRLWFLSQFEGVSQAYHISGGLRLRGALDAHALQRALDRIVARHASLRTTFVLVDGQALQQIAAEDSGFRLIAHDLREAQNREVELERLLTEEAQAPFVLEHGPLIRGRLVRLADDESVLFVTMHHIVSDGWSMGILINELSVLYRAFARGEADPLAPGERLAGERLAEILNENEISHVTLPPSVLHHLPEATAFSSLKTLVVAGEALSAVIAGHWAEGRRLINAYGPTETTVCACVHECDASATGAPPIGRPIANVRIYLLDAHGAPVPVGVVGELYIGGDGVGRGYLNRDALTTERFLTDPFSDDPTARMYRTGDLGRWRADGTIEFVGRNDHQVKIRGFRIELGEIEARLSAHADVRECVVVALADTTGSAKRLVAYWVGAEDVKSEHLGAEALRSWLSAVLPDYMVPAAYVRLDRLPLTPNGKLDRKALPAPDGAAYAARAYEAPQGATEQTIAAIWRDLLGLETIGRHDNFFALGGHSLLAVRVASRLRQELGVEIGVADLFVHATLHQLAACVTSSSGAVLPPIVSIELDAPRVLSFAQQRLWFLSQFEGVSQAYHISGGLRLRGALDAHALQRALDRIVARHASLRTTFVLVDGQALQQIAAEDSGFRLIAHDLREAQNREVELERLLTEEAQAPFVLEHGPLIRGRLVRLADDESVLFVTMHHIVSDGWSMGILINELSVLYRAFARGEADPLAL
ncbi:condensation domain-containing protein, partial [Xanthomonas sp. MUS 060]|uniref:condensation domain-containing protein n=1 Tax=Xanthomonas sp. MUS 060 TaxID=1588031 RepID=UPI0031B63FD0